MRRGGVQGAVLPGTPQEAPTPRRNQARAGEGRHSSDMPPRGGGDSGQHLQLSQERFGVLQSGQGFARHPQGCPGWKKPVGAHHTKDAN